MLKIAVSIALALAVAGCAAPPSPQPIPVLTTTTPVCTGKVQCEAMWILAQQAVQDVSGMKIRLLTDTRIETFSPSKMPLMTGTVTRYPVAADKYEMRLQLDCYRYFDCDSIRVSSIDLFNIRVARAAD